MIYIFYHAIAIAQVNEEKIKKSEEVFFLKINSCNLSLVFYAMQVYPRELRLDGFSCAFGSVWSVCESGEPCIAYAKKEVLKKTST